MRILVAMSGGVDSSVAAALLLGDGHDVVGATLKLWGGDQDSGCCSVGDVEDARRVAQQLDIAHHVFNFTDDFDAHVVAPYVEAHAGGRTPNPCVECNRHLKFDRLLARADQLGFDAVATGHHARITDEGSWRLWRGADRAKDQSYVVHMLGQAQLPRLRFPVGALTKAEVRARAASLNLRTADKPESQDTCFITATGGRAAFLGARIPLQVGRVVDRAGRQVGTVPAVELITVGQRRGLGGGNGGGPGALGGRLYAVDVNVVDRTVTVGDRDELLTDRIEIDSPAWVVAAPPIDAPVSVQASAHGAVASGVWDGSAVIVEPRMVRPAPGQSVVLYDGDEVLGGGVAR
jgi:tRNA-specific 2-thiouridylase